MKKRNKLALGILGLATVALFASGCTANFCTDIEKSRIAYALEPGVSEFVIEGTGYDTTDVVIDEVVDGKVHQIIRATKDEQGRIIEYKNSAQLNTILNAAKQNAVAIPSIDYFYNLLLLSINAL